MPRQPEHALYPAFEKAREWAAEQERLLTEEQRQTFEAMKFRQGLERKRQHDRLEALRKQFDEKARKREPKPELALKPPVLVNDPYRRRQARYIMAGEKRLAALDMRHTNERTDALKKFEQERAKSNQDKTLAGSWHKALQKTVQQEIGREQDRGKDLDRSK